MKFKGCGTALVTPFRHDGTLDEPRLRSLVRRQVDEGIDFLVPCGTTGESPTLTREEHLRVVQITIEETARRVPVLAGAGGYNTAEVVALAQEVEDLGADGILSVTPYYNKPTQEGLFQHYKAIASQTKLPIIVYSVQARTGVNIEPATVERLAQIENIVGIKEASGNIAQMASIMTRVPADFAVLSGDDAVALALIGLGGHGLISVVSNIIPREATELVQAALTNNFDRARQLQRQYLRLSEAIFLESNPIPVKAALAMMGLLDPIWRLPLVPMNPANEAKLRQVMQTCGVIGS